MLHEWLRCRRLQIMQMNYFVCSVCNITRVVSRPSQTNCLILLEDQLIINRLAHHHKSDKQHRLFIAFVVYIPYKPFIFVIKCIFLALSNKATTWQTIHFFLAATFFSIYFCTGTIKRGGELKGRRVCYLLME